jgi:hypothetical protein
MTNQVAERTSPPVFSGRRLAVFAAVLGLGFALFYLVTRAPITGGDAFAFLELVRLGDASRLHYGESGHFIQVPLAHAVWTAANAAGLPVSAEFVFVGISLAGTLVAIVFFGLIAADVLQDEAAGWIAAVLIGTSLNLAVQWNGELYGLALGFVTAALYGARRGRIVVPAILWALAILSHVEFVFAGLAFGWAIWLCPPKPRSGEGGIAAGIDARKTVRRLVTLLAIAGFGSWAVLLIGARIIGKWTDLPSLLTWLEVSLASRQLYTAPHPEIVRAAKGLLTAFTVGGHYLRDVLTARGSAGAGFIVAFAAGVLVIAATAVFLLAGLRHRRVAVFALLWLLPFHVLVNWWFVPTVEKYHAGALPGFVLLVTGGLVLLTSRLTVRTRRAVIAVYVVACAALNLFGALLPMQAVARDTLRGRDEVRRFVEGRGGKAVFLACDEPKALILAGVPYLRIRSIWNRSIPEMQATLTAWVAAQLRDGKEPYLFGRVCLPEEWKTTWSKAPFDLYFLEQSFTIAPTAIAGVPLGTGVPTSPFTWARGDLVRLEAR